MGMIDTREIMMNNVGLVGSFTKKKKEETEEEPSFCESHSLARISVFRNHEGGNAST